MDEATAVEASQKIVDAGQRIEDLKVETVEAIVGFVREAADFAAQEVPLLVQEVLNFGLLDNGVWAGLWLLVFGTATWLFIKALGWEIGGDDNRRSCDCDTKVGACVASGLASIGSGCMFLIYMIDTLQVVIAPRMYLLKMLAAL
jgi:hypothetical protein